MDFRLRLLRTLQAIKPILHEPNLRPDSKIEGVDTMADMKRKQVRMCLRLS